MPEHLRISVAGFGRQLANMDFAIFYFILTCARCGDNDFNFAFARRMARRLNKEKFSA
jgi:hypothetical protein